MCLTVIEVNQINGVTVFTLSDGIKSDITAESDTKTWRGRADASTSTESIAGSAYSRPNGEVPQQTVPYAAPSQRLPED